MADGMIGFAALIAAGGPMAKVREAADETARREAAFWALAIADMLAREKASSDADPVAVATMDNWLKELRRLADIKPAPEKVRAQTRERGRRSRERRWAAEGPS
jgi:hypothetical protein